MMKTKFLGANIGDCPHTEGLYKAARLASMGNINTFVCKVNLSAEQILSEIDRFNPDYVGFSYRLSSENGYKELKRILSLMDSQGLLNTKDGRKRKIAFAGLPDTLAIIKAREYSFPVPVFAIPQLKDPVSQTEVVFDFFDFNHQTREIIMEDLKEELFPPRIAMLDQLADSIIENDNYRSILPLPVPSDSAKKSYITRMKESPYPLIRSHFGIPSDSIQPTIEGIRQIADARVIDEVSIGSSDLSQRYYGKPEEFKKRKNDGGVPYKDKYDLKELFLASRTGNFPACKPYAHTTGILDFIDDCVEVGMLIGAHQAMPLYWFNQLDGRGSTPVKESILEHVLAVRKLAKLGIPVEMNDPNQWSSRWAHDTIVAADYAIISSVMLEAGVKDIVLQMQFNKPVETSDYADLAKMKTGALLARKVAEEGNFNTSFHHETRTGIESFSTDIQQAKWQLARSTLLQMFLNPGAIHLVSYCEAVRAATAEDIIESSQIIRKAVDVFRENEPDLRKLEQDPLVEDRIDFLYSESKYLLNSIAKLDASYNEKERISKFLSNPDTIYKSIERGYMAAPGIMNPDFKNEKLVTKPMLNGYFNAVDFETGKKILTERERIEMLRA